ncbi:uncharacterized protein LOC109613956 [Musca domestica]|uniref:Uncharacterized protein LOC109613956 n=1 Tax=Musca domestica TaxID=7370 RepID=A0ABM3VCU3_MUSDO|nr:uncharacterized protein LOC109613956 [Musca domestica]
MLWIWILGSVSLAAGHRFDFIRDSEDIAEDCPNMPDTKGIFDIVDLTGLTIEFNEGYVSCSGEAKMMWEDVEPTDRIAGYGELFKFQRGTWQPTTFFVRVFNFCERQFDNNSIWYDIWTRHIREEHRKCINHYGHVYHYQPFDVETVNDFPTNMEGRHKIVIHLDAYDKQNVKRRNAAVCFQISGEFIKVK